MLAHRAGEGGWSVGGRGAVVPSTAVYDRGQPFEIVQAVASFCVSNLGKIS